jgi:hypothetical protein
VHAHHYPHLLATSSPCASVCCLHPCTLLQAKLELGGCGGCDRFRAAAAGARRG